MGASHDIEEGDRHRNETRDAVWVAVALTPRYSSPRAPLHRSVNNLAEQN